MVKKAKAADKHETQGSAAGLFDSEMARSVKESAQQIWLAGMGAFAKAQAEGRQVFESLVKEGTSLQKKTQTVAEEKLGEVTSKMTSMADDVTAKAGQQWDKLETIFEDRTARALQKLGVPSSRDVQALKDRIDALTAQMSGRSKSTASARRSGADEGSAKKAPKPMATKTTARRAPRKSAAKKPAP